MTPGPVGETDKSSHSVQLEPFRTEEENRTPDVKVIANSSAILRYAWVWTLDLCGAVG